MIRMGSNPPRAAAPDEPAPTRGALRRLLKARDRFGGDTRGVSATSPLVDANVAAQLFGVPPTWLLAQARARKVPHHKLGHYVRFDLDELIDWLEETRVDPGPPPRRR
ncbi:MAG: helix-turn-helix domain-containing protein [Actinobacteria bacterium]|nr:helix-turn-helix domain-containing protein [Actinomycetota bacterium]